MKKYVLLLVCLLVIFVGCAKKESQEQVIQQPNFSKLEQYKDSYAGDNSSMAAIANELPHRKWFKDMEIKEETIILNFKSDNEMNDNYSSFTGNKEQWQKEAVIASLFYFLIPRNVKSIQLHSSNNQSIIIEKSHFLFWLKENEIKTDNGVHEVYKQVIHKKNIDSLF